MSSDQFLEVMRSVGYDQTEARALWLQLNSTDHVDYLATDLVMEWLQGEIDSGSLKEKDLNTQGLLPTLAWLVTPPPPPRPVKKHIAIKRIDDQVLSTVCAGHFASISFQFVSQPVLSLCVCICM